MHEIKLPQLGQTVEEATITQWLKKEGDTVAVGDVLFTVQTDKAEIECESTAAGVLRKIVVGEGVEVPVLTVVALVGGADEALPESAGGTPVTTAIPKDQGTEKTKGTEEKTNPVLAAAATLSSLASLPSLSSGAAASPRAKKLAAAKGVDVSSLAGSGPNGRVIEADVLVAKAAPKAHTADPKLLEELRGLVKPNTPTARRLARETGIDLDSLLSSISSTGSPRSTDAPIKSPGRYPLTPMRRVIATRMAESKYSAPHFYVTVEVDMKAATEARKKAEGFKPSFNDLIVQAVARTLRAFPQVNARWLGDAYEIVSEVNIGVAVALEDGLIVPVLRNADTLSLQQISEGCKALAEKARKNKLMPDDYTGSTFTISNLGAFGVDHFTAIINQPDSAILAVGRVADQVVAVDGGIQVRPRMKMTLSSDHRVIDGAVAAQFMAKLKNELESHA
ncbi:MAG: Dihydrolipoyllysine-residue acetyltransferase component of pyruvate dehydrogenase complex [Candidatus Hydrogenedentota bacterium]|jgi:pyruvate dehydrogenase E2 component (dihydrolipoamide acetyltransferase)